MRGSWLVGALMCAGILGGCQSEPETSFVAIDDATIEAAAVEIAEIDARLPVLETMDVVTACYTEKPNVLETLTPDMQACIVKELVVVKTATGQNAEFPSMDPNMANPLGQRMLLSMFGERVSVLMNTRNVPRQSGRAFVERANKIGLPAYTEALRQALDTQ